MLNESAITLALPPGPNRCDEEPIHTPDAIQPHGALLAIHETTLVIAHAAGDTSALLGLPPAALCGRSIGAVLDRERCERLTAVLASEASLQAPTWLFEIKAKVTRLPADVIAYRTSGLVVLEFERKQSALPYDPTIAQEMIRHVHGADTVEESCEVLARQVRAVSGFDRVVIYRFTPDGSGKVISEVRRDAVSSLLGMQFPASDIPVQVRALYVKNRFRIIPDARYVPAPILPPPEGRLDLTHSELRSVSPSHREYLANMGVVGSMSLSIVVNNRLWGLVACHNLAPRTLPFHLREAFKRCAELVALNLEMKFAEQVHKGWLNRLRMHEDLVIHMSHEAEVARGLLAHRPDLTDLVPASGAAFYFDGHFGATGQAPDRDQCAALAAWLGADREDDVYYTDHLPLIHPPARPFAGLASGLLAITVPLGTPTGPSRGYVLWFRPEVIRTVVWAGNPSEAKRTAASGADRPRLDFAAWPEKVRWHADPWEDTEIDAARRLRASVLRVMQKRRDLGGYAVAPPSTGSATPLTNEASSDSRNSAALAISSG